MDLKDRFSQIPYKYDVVQEFTCVVDDVYLTYEQYLNAAGATIGYMFKEKTPMAKPIKPLFERIKEKEPDKPVTLSVGNSNGIW